MKWILDGYNVILADHKLAAMARNSIEGSRRELIQEIAFSGKFRGDRIVLVFDGRSGGAVEKITPNFEIRFSASHETADELIKKIVGNHEKRSSITVVSNDRSIINYAKECGAKVIGSKDFLSFMRCRRRERETIEHLSEKPTPKFDPELLKLFKENKHET
ncbi:MAG TPA: NYN domain-containing protein [Candidatus Acidoferrales bacterium]|nr:NYN domain-containing protein [Candidatus Acidoferrales bacterium]